MKLFKRRKTRTLPKVIWARPEMRITFRAELMPGRSSEERTYIIEKVLSTGRVTLYDFAGEHQEAEFEPVNFLRGKAR